MNQLPTSFAIGGVAHPVDFLRDGQGIYGIGVDQTPAGLPDGHGRHGQQPDAGRVKRRCTGFLGSLASRPANRPS